MASAEVQQLRCSCRIVRVSQQCSNFSSWSACLYRIRIPIRELPDKLEQDLWLELQHPKKEVSLLCTLHMCHCAVPDQLHEPFASANNMTTALMPFCTASACVRSAGRWSLHFFPDCGALSGSATCELQQKHLCWQ